MNIVKYVKVIDYDDGSRKVVIKGGRPIDIEKLQISKQIKKEERIKLLTKIEQLEEEIKSITNISKKQVVFDFDNKEDKLRELQVLYAKYVLEFAPKLENALRSLRRSKNELLDILKNNDFDYFLTLTFDKNKVDRLNDDLTRKKFCKWCNHIRTKLPDMIYVAVPRISRKRGATLPRISRKCKF